VYVLWRFHSLGYEFHSSLNSIEPMRKKRTVA
jgi:hypothetical protein